MKLDTPKQSTKPCPECRTSMRVKLSINPQFEVERVHTCPSCHFRERKVVVAATKRYRAEHNIVTPPAAEPVRKRIFIISPYSDPDNVEVLLRVHATEQYFLSLIRQGHFPVSVIVSCHHLTVKYKVLNTFDFWSDYCLSEMATCDEVHLLKLEGWETSVGVISELNHADKLKKTILKVEQLKSHEYL